MEKICGQNDMKIALSAREKKLLEYIHGLKSGEIVILIEKGEPVLVESAGAAVEL